MSNRLTQGEALVGALHVDDSVEAVGDVTAGDDLVSTDDVVVGDDLDVTGDTRTATLRVGAAGTVVKTVKYGSAALDLAEILAGAGGFGTITITGAAVGDIVVINNPIFDVGLAVTGYRVTGANTLQINVTNFTAAPINAGSVTVEYLWFDLT